VLERNENGPFTDVFDFVKRINLRSVNKRALEALAMAGAFDEVQEKNHRAQYFYKFDDGENLIEKLIKFGNKAQSMANSAQASLFGEMEEVQIQNPVFPECDKWSNIKELNLEKDLIGFYLSGHPLDTYEDTIRFFVKHTIENVTEMVETNQQQMVRFAGVVTRAQVRESVSNGNKYGFFTVEDKSGSVEFALFTEKFLKYHHLLQVDNYVFFQAKIQSSYRDKTKSELNFSEILMLDEVMNKNTKTIKMQLMLEDLTSDFIQEFLANIKKSPGSARVQLFFNDNQQILEMMPKSNKVKASEFVAYLKQNQQIKYKLS
jgi:DNA polymerase-3 subunit alpha